MATQENNEQQEAEINKEEVGEELKKVAVDGSSASDVAKENNSKMKSSSSKLVVHKADYQPDVVYLYQLCRSGTIPSISPFCLKVETWLRVAGVKYENIDHRIKLRSKKGKLPFVELNGAQIADSAIIIHELGSSKNFDRDLDANLTKEQRAIGHALESMLENHTSWVYRWWRFNNGGEFLVTSKTNLRQALKSKLPAGIINFFVKMKLRSKRSDAIGHGIGVHSADEIYEFCEKDLLNLNEFLGDKPYFFGDEPTTLDVVAFSHLTQMLYCHGDKFPPKVFMDEKCPQLVAHVERIKERYWPDWKEMCENLQLNTHLPKPEPETPIDKENINDDNNDANKKGDSDDNDGEEKKDKEKDADEKAKNGGKKNKENKDNKLEQEENETETDKKD